MSKKTAWKKKLPARFLFWLEAVGLEVVLVQPEDINVFAADFFERQLARRSLELPTVPTFGYYHQICSKRFKTRRASMVGYGGEIELKKSSQLFNLDEQCRRDSLEAHIVHPDDDEEYKARLEKAMAQRQEDEDNVDAAADDDDDDERHTRADIYIPHVSGELEYGADEDDKSEDKKSVKSEDKKSVKSEDKQSVKSEDKKSDEQSDKQSVKSATCDQQMDEDKVMVEREDEGQIVEELKSEGGKSADVSVRDDQSVQTQTRTLEASEIGTDACGDVAHESASSTCVSKPGDKTFSWFELHYGEKQEYHGKQWVEPEQIGDTHATNVRINEPEDETRQQPEHVATPASGPTSEGGSQTRPRTVSHAGAGPSDDTLPHAGDYRKSRGNADAGGNQKFGQSQFFDTPTPGVNVSGTISVATTKRSDYSGPVTVEVLAEADNDKNDIIDVEINLHCHCQA